MTSETLALPGLTAPGSITIDRWGLPHIRAESVPDLFFLQGVNAARDRLWQIDLWRKRGLGLLAADFGPGFLEQDAASRLFLYRGDMAAEWAAYGPDAQAICESFAAGINAFIALTEREPARLPPEFALMGTRPARWRPEDVVRIRSHGLTRNALWEVARLEVLARADHETDLLRKNLEPPRRPEPLVPPGSVPMAALDLFRLGGASVTFTPERLAATPETAGRWRKTDDLGEVLADLEWTGSNNWAVDARRSGTGAPIMASDPHRAHAVPSLRYLVHLTAPGLDVIGAGEPCVPGVSLGHNGEAAFSLTIFGADQEDVYVVETDPAAPHLYRFDGGWEEMERVDESFAVKGAPDERRTADYTRHGPVLWRDPERTRAVVVRSVWFEPGAPYLQSLAMMRAQSLNAFTASAVNWGTPSVNLVYADRAGTIAWRPGGFMPVRVGWDGLLPVPGDGRFEWRGFRDQASLPMTVNPASGFVHSANEANLPADWPHDDAPIGFEWTEASRAMRIAEALADGRHGVAEARALQTDATSRPARRMSALLLSLSAEGAAGEALRLLASWDHRLDAASGPAALFEVWWTLHLKPALFARLAPDPAVRKLLAPGDVEGMLRALEAPDRRGRADPAAARDALLLETLASAFADVAARLGPDPAVWAWGKLHHGAFDHALWRVGGAPEWNVGPLPKGGSASTPMHAGYRPSDFRVTNGASFRMVVDLADPDRSVCINSPGQSGDPRSAHYADLAPLWARGVYVPMLYSSDAVDAAADTLIRCEPAVSEPLSPRAGRGRPIPSLAREEGG